MKVLITCEHGGNKVPASYWPLFKNLRGALQTHRGYDPGALALARDFAKAFDAELVYSTTSRLLVELNRSPNHKQVFLGSYARLPAATRERLLQRYYWAYRNWVEAQVAAAAAEGERVVHISSHSFTPRLNGVTRRAATSVYCTILCAKGNARLCKAWREALIDAKPQAPGPPQLSIPRNR